MPHTADVGCVGRVVRIAEAKEGRKQNEDPSDAGAPARVHDDKVTIYRDFSNWDLLRVVEDVLPRGGRLLDVGCASGGLLRHLQNAAGFRVGVELSQESAREAARVGDHVVCGGVQDAHVEFSPASFDVVVCADVLEHLPDPSLALRRIRAWMAPGGALVVSVPNIANWQSRVRLLRGVWRYEMCGIWDSGHLRFFTLASLQSLLQEAGLIVESVGSTQAVSHQLPRVARVVGPGGLAWLERAARLLGRARPEVFAFQFVCVARKPPAEAESPSDLSTP